MNKALGESIKQLVIRVARGLGYEIVPTSRLMPRDLADHLRYLFAKLDITCVFDVGANTGQFGSFLRDDVGYEGLIVSFEPASRAVGILREKSQTDAGWIVYECALGSQSGTRSFNVMSADTLSSFLTPDDTATRLFAANNVVDHTEEVEVRTLDAVVAELRGQRDIGQGLYLKMDTQGYDLEVLAGADRSLAGIAAVQSELSCQRIYVQMPNYVTVLDALERRGFQMSGIFPVSQDTALRIIEADCVLVNGARIGNADVRLMWTNSA